MWSVVGSSDHDEIVHRLTLSVQHLACTDDPADLVKVKETERVVPSVEEVGELVVRRQIAVSCWRYPDLHRCYVHPTLRHSSTAINATYSQSAASLFNVDLPHCKLS